MKQLPKFDWDFIKKFFDEDDPQVKLWDEFSEILTRVDYGRSTSAEWWHIGGELDTFLKEHRCHLHSNTTEYAQALGNQYYLYETTRLQLQAWLIDEMNKIVIDLLRKSTMKWLVKSSTQN